LCADRYLMLYYSAHVLHCSSAPVLLCPSAPLLLCYSVTLLLCYSVSLLLCSSAHVLMCSSPFHLHLPVRRYISNYALLLCCSAHVLFCSFMSRLLHSYDLVMCSCVAPPLADMLINSVFMPC
jgi:hypothetical protein